MKTLQLLLLWLLCGCATMQAPPPVVVAPQAAAPADAPSPHGRLLGAASPVAAITFHDATEQAAYVIKDGEVGNLAFRISDSTYWKANAPGASISNWTEQTGGVGLGGPVGGATANAVLYADSSINLKSSPHFTYNGDTLQLYATNDLKSLDFLDFNGHRTSYFGQGGEYYTGHSAVISGYATNDGGGQTVSIDPAFPAPNASAMVSVGSDVADAVAIRSPGAVNDTTYYLLLGGAGTVYATPHFTIRMDADGSLRWGDTTTNSIGNYDLNFSRMSAKYGQFFGTATGADFAVEVSNQAGNGTGNTASLYLGPHSGFSGNPVSPGVQGFNVANNGGLRLLTFDGSQEVPLQLAPSGAFSVMGTRTASGSTGAQTINKPTGSVNFAAAATSLVVTDSVVASTSHVFCTVETNDATAIGCRAVPAAGSFTLYVNAAATAETRVAFWVIDAL